MGLKMTNNCFVHAATEMKTKPSLTSAISCSEIRNHHCGFCKNINTAVFFLFVLFFSWQCWCLLWNYGRISGGWNRKCAAAKRKCRGFGASSLQQTRRKRLPEEKQVVGKAGKALNQPLRPDAAHPGTLLCNVSLVLPEENRCPSPRWQIKTRLQKKKDSEQLNLALPFLGFIVWNVWQGWLLKLGHPSGARGHPSPQAVWSNRPPLGAFAGHSLASVHSCRGLVLRSLDSSPDTYFNHGFIDDTDVLYSD